MEYSIADYTIADFLECWNSPDIRKVRHKICEKILDKGRWAELIDREAHKGEGPGGSRWSMTAERRRDIYPLAGPKHKKWFITVQVVDSNGKYTC